MPFWPNAQRGDEHSCYKKQSATLNPPPACAPLVGAHLVRDRSAGVYRFVGWSRTSALLQKAVRHLESATRLRPPCRSAPCARPQRWDVPHRRGDGKNETLLRAPAPHPTLSPRGEGQRRRASARLEQLR